MKHVIGVSLGSSKRNHSVEAEFLGEKFLIERIGTDGDLNKAEELLRELDGKVDAFGMGGIDLYLVAGDRRYAIRDAQRLARAVTKSPIVDGSGLKSTLERRVIRYLADSQTVPLQGKKSSASVRGGPLGYGRGADPGRLHSNLRRSHFCSRSSCSPAFPGPN
jgi:hypothetical protein